MSSLIGKQNPQKPFPTLKIPSLCLGREGGPRIWEVTPVLEEPGSCRALIWAWHLSDAPNSGPWDLNMTWTLGAWECCPETIEPGMISWHKPLCWKGSQASYRAESNLCSLQLVPVMVSVEICANPHLSRPCFNSQPLGLVILIPLLNKWAPKYLLGVWILQGWCNLVSVPHLFLMCEAGKFEWQLVVFWGSF